MTHGQRRLRSGSGGGATRGAQLSVNPPPSVPDLIAAIEAYLQANNNDPKPFVWTATAEEKPRLWQVVRDQWRNYDVYQSRTDRDIPVVVLTPR